MNLIIRKCEGHIPSLQDLYKNSLSENGKRWKKTIKALAH